MRLISKKTPFIIAGGEAIRRKLVEAREAATKRRRRKRWLTITGLGAVLAGVAVVAKKRRSTEEFAPFIEPPRKEITPDEILDLREETTTKTEDPADGKGGKKAESGKASSPKSKS